MPSFAQSMMDKIDSGSTVIWVYMSGDQGRVERQLKVVAAQYTQESELDLKWYSWNCVGGASWDAEVKDPLKALSSVATRIPAHGLVLMKDFGTYLNGGGIKNLELRRALAELCISNALTNDTRTRPIVICSNSPTPHPEIAEYCDVIDFDLPRYDEMRHDVVDFIVDSTRRGNKAQKKTAYDDDLLENITRALLGTTSEEAQRIFAYAVTRCRGIVPEVLEVIAEEKAKVIRKVEGLRFIPHAKIPDAAVIGGFSYFLTWLRKRARAYSQHARSVNLELPRGSVLIGPPGTGKTLVAKAAAKMLGLDLILMDIGSMFDKYVGSSEAKIRGALQTVAAMPNALLMVDEIDKAFAGAHENQASDSGVASRVLSYFLNWLSERDMSSETDNRVFVMVTMNRTRGVDSAMLRSGRFDRVWSTDLPDRDERLEILKIHLNKRGVPASSYGDRTLDAIVKVTDDYTGAELEEIVISARNDAYDSRMTAWEKGGKKGRAPDEEAVRPTIDELLEAAGEITPVAKLDATDIADIRKFCQENTYPVNGERVRDTTRTRARRKVSTTRAQSGGDPENN